MQCIDTFENTFLEIQNYYNETMHRLLTEDNSRIITMFRGTGSTLTMTPKYWDKTEIIHIIAGLGGLPCEGRSTNLNQKKTKAIEMNIKLWVMIKIW